jgi:hypothetical protein
MGMQYRPLDFSPLLKSIALRNKANAKTSSTTKKDDPIDALTGAANQYYGEIERLKTNISNLETELGEGAYLTDEYKQNLSQLSALSSPATVVAAQRQKEHWTKNQGTVNTDNSHQNVDLDHFNKTGEVRTNHQRLIDNELGVTNFMPNPQSYGTSYYDYSFNPGLSKYNGSDALDEFDQLFEPANNQYNLSSDLINKISTQIAKGAGGQEAVRVKELKFDKSDKKNLRAAGEQALGRFTGGYLDLTDPLVNGMYQSFVSRTGGGKGDTKFPIEDKNGNTKMVSLEGGKDNEKWFDAFHYFVRDEINAHMQKRADVKLVRQLSASGVKDDDNNRKNNKTFLNSPSTSGSSSYVIESPGGKVDGSISPDLVNKTRDFLKDFNVFDFSNQTSEKTDDYKRTFIRKKGPDGKERWTINDQSTDPRGYGSHVRQDPLKAIEAELKALRKQGYVFDGPISGLPVYPEGESKPITLTDPEQQTPEQAKEGEYVDGEYSIPGPETDFIKSYYDLPSDYADLPILKSRWEAFRKKKEEEWKKNFDADTGSQAKPQIDVWGEEFHDEINDELIIINKDINDQMKHAVQLNATEDFFKIPLIRTQGASAFTKKVFVKGNTARQEFVGLPGSLSPGTYHNAGDFLGTIHSVGSIVEFTLGPKPTNFHQINDQWGYWEPGTGQAQTEVAWTDGISEGQPLLNHSKKSAEEIDILKGMTDDSKNNPIHGSMIAQTNVTMSVPINQMPAFIDKMSKTKINTTGSDYDKEEVEQYAQIFKTIRKERRKQPLPKRRAGTDYTRDYDLAMWKLSAKDFKEKHGIDKELAVEVRDFMNIKDQQAIDLGKDWTPLKYNDSDLVSEFIGRMYKNQGLTTEEIKAQKQYVKEMPVFDEANSPWAWDGELLDWSITQKKHLQFIESVKNGTAEEMGFNKLALSQMNLRFDEKGENLLYDVKVQVNQKLYNQLNNNGQQGFKNYNNQYQNELYDNSATSNAKNMKEWELIEQP